jgi:hypothetical protein
MAILHVASNDGDSLTIDREDTPDPFWWRITLQSTDLSATADFDTDVVRFHALSLADYFASLAADWRGWSGTRTWGRNTLILEATHDGLGHIALTVKLGQNLYPNAWRAQVTLKIDAGALDAIARDAASFEPPAA